MQKFKVFVIALTFFVTVVSYAEQKAEEKKPEDIDVVTACKTDCPEAKTNAEAHECAEKKGKIRPSFKKTKCWEVNEEYEKLLPHTPETKK